MRLVGGIAYQHHFYAVCGRPRQQMLRHLLFPRADQVVLPQRLEKRSLLVGVVHSHNAVIEAVARCHTFCERAILALHNQRPVVVHLLFSFVGDRPAGPLRDRGEQTRNRRRLSGKPRSELGTQSRDYSNFDMIASRARGLFGVVDGRLRMPEIEIAVNPDAAIREFQPVSGRQSRHIVERQAGHRAEVRRDE